MNVQLRETVLALALCINLIACERTEEPRTSRSEKIEEPRASQSERQGTGRYAPQSECPVVGNSATHIYHLPGDRNYGQMLEENKNKKRDNRVCFNSSAEAEMAGYRRSRTGRTK